MKKGSLNLSVNAIIIFVLAFAMLGVGIFVTSQLKNIGTGGLDKARELINAIEEDPTADKPLVGISKSLTIPAKKKMDMAIKLYNKDTTGYLETVAVIDNCKDTTTGDTKSHTVVDGKYTYPVLVVSDTVDISASSFEAIPFTITNKDLTGGETYICKLLFINETGLDTEPYYSHSFHLTVSS
jgi:hypothetical protein